jgi:hypothetical protein
MNSDVTSDLRRPLAVESFKPPLLNSHETHITCERYTIDAKHELNTDRKPWSTNRLAGHFLRATCVSKWTPSGTMWTPSEKILDMQKRIVNV